MPEIVRLAAGGLTLISRGGGFGGQPFTSASDHQVCTTRVATALGTRA